MSFFLPCTAQTLHVLPLPPSISCGRLTETLILPYLPWQAFREMKKKARTDPLCTPNAVTYSCLSSACWRGRRPDIAQEVVDEALSLGLMPVRERDDGPTLLADPAERDDPLALALEQRAKRQRGDGIAGAGSAGDTGRGWGGVEWAGLQAGGVVNPWDLHDQWALREQAGYPSMASGKQRSGFDDGMWRGER